MGLSSSVQRVTDALRGLSRNLTLPRTFVWEDLLKHGNELFEAYTSLCLVWRLFTRCSYKCVTQLQLATVEKNQHTSSKTCHWSCCSSTTVRLGEGMYPQFLLALCAWTCEQRWPTVQVWICQWFCGCCQREIIGLVFIEHCVRFHWDLWKPHVLFKGQ